MGDNGSEWSVTSFFCLFFFFFEVLRPVVFSKIKGLWGCSVSQAYKTSLGPSYFVFAVMQMTTFSYWGRWQKRKKKFSKLLDTCGTSSEGINI